MGYRFTPIHYVVGVGSAPSRVFMIDVRGFFLGLIEVFLYGLGIGALYGFLANFFFARF